MGFRNWLEITLAGTATRPGETAKVWWQNIPGKNYTDKALVRRIAAGLTNPKACGVVRAARLAGDHNRKIKIFQQPIIGTLLNDIPQGARYNPLGHAYAAIEQDNFRCQFLSGWDFFQSVAPMPGTIEVVVPPLEFVSIDEIALASCIIHECQHAEDWVFDRMPEYKFNQHGEVEVNDYLENEAEARAFSKQMLAMAEMLQQRFNMTWEQITQSIVEMMKQMRVGMEYAFTVVEEFMRIVQRQTSEAVATMPMPRTQTKEQIIRQMAQLFVQQINKYKAKDFLADLKARQHGRNSPQNI